MQIASKRGDHRCNLILKSIYKDDKNLLGREGGLVFLHRVILICTSRSPQGLTSHLNFTVEFEARFEEYEIHLSAKNNDAWNCRQHMCFRLLQSTTKPALVFKIERWKSTCSSHSHSKKKCPAECESSLLRMPLFRLHFHYRKKTMLTTAENLWPAI